MSSPVLIQGGMGVGVSNWQLARAVSLEGQLGVVSGTMIDTVFARRLQDGDPGEHMQRACLKFPDQELAERVYQRLYVPGGKAKDAPYFSLPMMGIRPSVASVELTVLANFAEVFLAKEGHQGLVGINYLEKIQMPTLPSLYGAMLAGVDYVLMGAGIPKAIPGILDALSQHQKVSMKLFVEANAGSEQDNYLSFDPGLLLQMDQPLKRPKFIAIVSSHTLAANLAKKSSGKVDGFVIENHTAGGHNAPPRGPLKLSENGEPVYGERDAADLNEMRKLGLPFWLAGGMYGSCGSLQAALDAGATGVQIGTPFAFCKESGIKDDLKNIVLQNVQSAEVGVFTDPCASASGYPFKVTMIEGTLADEAVFEERERVCDLGYLRTPYERDDHSIGFRCPGEPVGEFVRKGGAAADTCDRKCLCNALLATIGLGQVRKEHYVEPALVTAGDNIMELRNFIEKDALGYSAKSVIDKVLQH